MRKYNGSYTIPIKKHTKVRRPMSRWQVNVRGGFGAIRASSFEELTNYTAPVTDLSIGLENPLDLRELFKDVPYIIKQEFLTPQALKRN